MRNTRVSYTFGEVNTYIDESQLSTIGDDPIKYSYNFTPPENGGISPIIDYVPASVGGTFGGLVGYSGAYNLTGNLNFTYKSWVEDYVGTAITNLETGGLSQSTILGWLSSTANTPLTYNNLTGVFTLNKNLSQYTNDAGFLTVFNETDPVFTAWDKSTGITITKSQITDLGTPLTAETDPIFTAHPSYGITAPKISNWDTAYSWGNHALAGYKTSVLLSDITPYQGDLSILVSQLSDVANLNIPNDLQDLGFPTLGSGLQLLRVNSNGNGLEFFTIQHSNLGGILGSGSYHLNQAQHTIATQQATTTQSGYLHQDDWNTFNNKLDNFTAGNLLSFTGDTLNVNAAVLPVDDNITATTSTWSSSKIAEMLAGSEEESFTTVYTIRLNSGATVAQRLVGLVAGTDYPTNWVLTADSTALVITHNLNTLASVVKVFSKNGTTSDIVELTGNVAYATFTNKYGTGYNAIRLDALATITTELYIKILV